MDKINYHKKVLSIFKLKTLKYTIQMHILLLQFFSSPECI